LSIKQSHQPSSNESTYYLFNNTSFAELTHAGETATMITNIYIITAISVIGGTLFGFDLSSMSAM
jgi:hypothetical protein